MRPQLLFQHNGLCLVGLGGGQTRHMPTATYCALLAKHDAEAAAPARRALLAEASKVVDDELEKLNAERQKKARLLWLAESARKARELEQEREAALAKKRS